MANKKVFCYLFTYKLAGIKSPLSLVIANYNKKRAKEMFNEYVTIKALNIEGEVIVTNLHKNKNNKFYFTEEYLEKEIHYIDELAKKEGH